MGQGRIIVITGLPGTGKQGASGMAQLANRTLEEEPYEIGRAHV